jgi:hypothetical protein
MIDRRDGHKMGRPKSSLRTKDSAHEGRGAGMRRIGVSQLALGIFALTLGLVVYLTDRDPAHAMLIPTVGTLSSRHPFGAVGGWLPTFVHALAFSLFSAAVLPPAPRPAYWACALWGGVDVAFEFGQHPLASAPLAETLQAAFGSLQPAHWLANYFVRGTFDVGDLAAAVSGSLAAALALRWMHRPTEVRDAH